MILGIALSTLAATADPDGVGQAAAARRQATAMVRIISAARIDLDKPAELSEWGAQQRSSRVTDSDGAVVEARLIEFP